MNGDERVRQQICVEAERVAIPSRRGFIPAVVHRPEKIGPPERERSPGVVVCCHGLLSAKDSEKFVGMSDRLARQGLWAVRFDFTGCGENASAFGPSLVATRLDDLRCVLDWAVSAHRPWGAEAAVGLFGSSLGGYLSYVFCARHPRTVQALALWSAPARLRLIGAGGTKRPPELERLWPKDLPLGDPDAVDAVPSVPNVLIVHGTDDTLVPWDHAVVLYRHAGEEKRLVLLDGADHRLTDPALRAQAAEVSASWLARKLSA
ncbi:alpha/beta hydrolase family protein [Desulfosoma sp.]